jgi:cysteine synthase A
MAEPRGRIFGSILDAIGGTPLVRLSRFIEHERLGAEVLLKLEYLNPLGSVKDRIGLAMVEAAEQAGLLVPGQGHIVEPTSGNTGIALAFVAAAKGYRLTVVMPDSASMERQKMLRLMGATVELTPARQGMAGAIDRAEEIVSESSDAWMARHNGRGTLGRLPGRNRYPRRRGRHGRHHHRHRPDAEAAAPRLSGGCRGTRGKRRALRR